jgi:hypothetical protein
MYTCAYPTNEIPVIVRTAIINICFSAGFWDTIRDTMILAIIAISQVRLFKRFTGRFASMYTNVTN